MIPRPSRLAVPILLLACVATAQGSDALLFDDTFAGAGPQLGEQWAAFGWHLDGTGRAVESEGGYATALVGAFTAASYVLEARVSIAPFLGPSPADAVSLAFGQPSSTELDGIRLSYQPYAHQLALVRYDTHGGTGGEYTATVLASATLDLGNGTIGWKVVADAAAARIAVFIDRGAGYPATPALAASAVAVPTLGWTGLVRESESPGVVAVERFSVVRPVTAPTVASFTLIDADTDLPVPGRETLLDGAVLDLAQLPHRRLSVRANVAGGTVGSVRFVLDGAVLRTENSQPYALAGDAANGSDYLPWTPAVGDHRLVATPYAAANAAGTAGEALAVRFTVIDAPAPFAATINFQPAASPVPAGCAPDSGAVYGARAGGLVYGWSRVVPEVRDRGVASDQRYDTLILMQKTGDDAVWEMALPKGTYLVELVAGDPSFYDSVYRISVEGYPLVDAVPTSAASFQGGSAVVTVRDGRLTVRNVAGAVNNKLCFLVITPAGANG